MTVLFLVAGVVLIGLALVDALQTTVSASGGGPLTTRLARGLWQAALALHRPDSGSHRLLAAMGVAILLSVFLLWIVLLWGGYLLLFSAEPGAVVHASSGAPATFWERVYFTGFTVSTLGMGDFVPRGAAWRVLTAFASLNGLFLVTLSITYLLPVLSAVVAKRRLAATIDNLGRTPAQIVVHGWDGESLSSLEQPLAQLVPLIELHAQRHLAYPVLHFFHSTEERAAAGPRVAALSEALRLIEHLPAGVQPPPAVVHAARQAVDGFLSTLSSAFIQHAEQASDPPPDSASVRTLRAAGLPVEETIRDPQTGTSSEEGRRRRLLHAFIRDDGWTWDHVTTLDAADP
jgi:hypothetical protein